jgi:mono/diheme cytochrome c family protein
MRARISFLWILIAIGAYAQSTATRIAAPRFWNDRELADWANPVVGLNVRPGHFSERDYYATPSAEWVRTYPVYFPGREPAGYWEMLQQKKPEPLVTPGPRNVREWIAVGKTVFEEMDVPGFRSADKELFAVVRSVDAFTKRGGHAQKDGTVFGLRWVPTAKGLTISINDCAGCHTRIMPDGSRLNGAPFNDPGDGVGLELVNRGIAGFFPGDSPGMSVWRQFGVPWINNDVHESLKSMSPADLGQLFSSSTLGTFARFNGSPYYMTKVPDLIGIQDRKYIDHTATHKLRGPADVMRYAALVSCCDSADFGSHRLLTDAQRRIAYRISDEVAFAIAQYLFSLEPPPNPNSREPRAAAGKQVFDREGCGGCHTPPLYTNNKLTPAKGYTVPNNHPNRADIMPASVGTDPNLALKTRKGTGLYKVPSLKGLWYRGLIYHDGSISTLEEWFDPARLRDDFVPSGFKGPGVSRRAVPGHEFGLKLSAEEKAELIAFLKTL